MFGLEESEIDAICAIFRHYPAIISVTIFGSRAMGNYKKHSDIDLVYKGTLEEQQERHLYHELDDLPLPYQFDILAYNTIDNPALTDHIQRVGKLLFTQDLS